MGEVVAGRFELIDILDSGGGGTIWRAWDRRQLRYRAAKVLRHSDSDSVIRFVQESKRMIEHPHIVTPQNWFGEDDRVLFTMDLVRGGSVAHLLGDFGGLPPGWVIELAQQTADALGAVHAAGYIHRDVKPGNLLLDVTGRRAPHLRLADFGTAAKLGGPRLTITTAVLGTPGYLSPEALRGADPAPAQDIFALGVVMQQMTLGCGPDAPTDLEVPVGPELAELIGRMLAEDPADRPRSAEELSVELRSLPGAGDLAYGADEQDLVEIFDHMPAFPAGWDEQGPLAARDAVWSPEGRTERIEVSPPQEAPALVRQDPDTTVIPVETPDEARDETPGGAPVETPEEETPSARQPQWPVVLLAAAGIMLIVAAVLLA